MENFERELHGYFVKAEREVLAEELGRFDVDLPAVRIKKRDSVSAGLVRGGLCERGWSGACATEFVWQWEKPVNGHYVHWSYGRVVSPFQITSHNMTMKKGKPKC